MGASAKHIPYKGVGPMVTDLIGGQIDFATVALPSVQQHIKSGALRAIGAQAYFRSEKDKYAKLVKKAGIELQ